jgi:3-methylfumaryl-CoA hydratase
MAIRAQIDALKGLVGKTIVSESHLCTTALRRLNNCIPGWSTVAPGEEGRTASAAAAGRGEAAGEPIRSTAHWLFHTEADLLNLDGAVHDLGPDGNPELLPGYRRMWAGGAFDLRLPLLAGDARPAVKEQTIVSVTEKQSRTYGPVLFLKRRCRLGRALGHGGAGGGNATGMELCLEEELDHVYMVNNGYRPPAAEMELPFPGITAGSGVGGVGGGEPAGVWREAYEIDAVSLFRYSALTWNSHRVHYDAAYSTQVEKYPGLVVHGPLLCTFLLDMYQRRAGRQSGFRFEYRAVRPLFVGETAHIWGRRCGAPGDAREAELFATNDEGHVCMQASVTLHGQLA